MLYNASVKIFSAEVKAMKKILAIFLTLLVVFSTCSAAVFAVEIEETTAPEVSTEESTSSIKNEDGLVVPGNMNQFKTSIIFKIFEKIISFILSLFGAEVAPEVDKEGATVVDELASALDERLTDLFA